MDAMIQILARELGVPMVVAKKSRSVNLDGEMYVAEVESYTHKNTNLVIVAKKFLSAADRVLVVDDFLANGCALQGLISIVDAADAEQTAVIFDTLLGDNLAARKEFITMNGARYAKDADI